MIIPRKEIQPGETFTLGSLPSNVAFRYRGRIYRTITNPRMNTYQAANEYRPVLDLSTCRDLKLQNGVKVRVVDEDDVRKASKRKGQKVFKK